MTHHAEMNCLENTGRLTASIYRRCTLYSTLSPCPMCSGPILLYRIPRVIVGKVSSSRDPKITFARKGCESKCIQDAACVGMMRDFIARNPELWNEDIGE